MSHRTDTNLSSNQKQRKLIRNRRQSQRITTTIVNRARSELPPSQRGNVKASGKPFIASSKGAAERGIPNARAFAGGSGIGFVTTKGSGKLLAPSLNTARHEVAHTVGAGHRSIRLGSGGASSPSSQAQLRSSIRLQSPSPFAPTVPSLASKRSKLSRVQAVRPLVPSGSTVKAKPGTLRAAHHSPSEKRRKDARALSNKMQFRLRKAGRDF